MLAEGTLLLDPVPSKAREWEGEHQNVIKIKGKTSKSQIVNTGRKSRQREVCSGAVRLLTLMEAPKHNKEKIYITWRDFFLTKYIIH